VEGKRGGLISSQVLTEGDGEKKEVWDGQRDKPKEGALGSGAKELRKAQLILDAFLVKYWWHVP